MIRVVPVWGRSCVRSRRSNRRGRHVRQARGVCPPDGSRTDSVPFLLAGPMPSVGGYLLQTPVRVRRARSTWRGVDAAGLVVKCSMHSNISIAASSRVSGVHALVLDDAHERLGHRVAPGTRHRPHRRPAPVAAHGGAEKRRHALCPVVVVACAARRGRLAIFIFGVSSASFAPFLGPIDHLP